MEIRARRTLVKSAPELWELADDLERLESWSTGLIGSDAVEIVVTDRRPGQGLSWNATARGASARVALELAEKGFGTAVEITAHHVCPREAATNALERLLDELGSPDRRPFARS